jgi:hypothetical protein
MRIRTETKGRPRTADRLRRGTRRLLLNVPDIINESYPINDYGQSEGWAILCQHWRNMIYTRALDPAELRAAIIPVAGLASAMLESYLRATPHTERMQAFDQLCAESKRVLSGRPSGVILQSGIIGIER